MKRHLVKDWPISRVCLLIQSTLTRVNTNTLLHVVEFMWPSNVVVVLCTLHFDTISLFLSPILW